MLSETPVFHAMFGLRSGGSITVGIIAEHARRVATGVAFAELRLMLLLAGSGTACMPDSDHRLGPGSLLVRPPRVQHDIYRDGNWRELYVTLPADAHGVLAELGLPDEGCLGINLSGPPRQTVRALIDAARGRSDPACIAIRIAELLRVATHVPIGTQARSSGRERLAPAEHLLSSIAGFRATIDVAAAAARMRPDTFRKAFVRAYGMSPTRFRLESRVAAACDMLSEIDVPVALIAERLGYSDQFAFSKQFRSIMGCSPTEFRSGMR